MPYIQVAHVIHSADVRQCPPVQSVLMIPIGQLEKISRIPTASWALWNPDGPNDINFFASRREQLHGRVVVLGLNRSRGAQLHGAIPFINFHTPKHRGDRRLERFIQGENLSEICGAYMTDLSLVVETDSNKVVIENPKDALAHLYSQLSFSQESERFIICMGDKTFETLCRALELNAASYRSDPCLDNLRIAKGVFEKERWTLFRVWFHSSYGRFQRLGDEELPKQLKRINDTVKASR